MNRELGGAVELLERSLAYTRVALSAVGPAELHRPTPCAGWSLAMLLAHMEDALDAFTEAADGVVGDEQARSVRADDREPRPGSGPLSGTASGPASGPASARAWGRDGDRLGRLQGKACRLLGVWAARAEPGPGGPVTVGDLALDAPLLVDTAALEITVHGWDVARATGRTSPPPAALAAALLPVAGLVAPARQRGTRFAAPVSLPPGTGPGERLLGFLGRDPSGPAAGNRPVPPPVRPPGS